MPLPDFHVSAPFPTGIELERQVVNPPGYDLSQDSSALIASLAGEIKSGEVKHDITESMLEIATGVCRDIHQAYTQLTPCSRRSFTWQPGGTSVFAAATPSVSAVAASGGVR